MTKEINPNLLRDERVDCWSLMTTMVVDDYVALVQKAYQNRGGLKYQREAIKTTSGKRIRTRMVGDIIRGAILPPVVIGVVIDDDELERIRDQDPSDILNSVRNTWNQRVSIIDGMQRTTALLEAIEQDKAVGSNFVRVEFWISRSTDSLIYRMLVLNTGQVPWNLKHQLQVVYAPLIDEMQKRIQFERLLTLEKASRRTKGGEFNADSLVEAYLAFGLRRTEIDTQETLADEFSRLDMAEALSLNKYSKFFYPIVQAMVNLDLAFSRLDASPEDGTSEENVGANKFFIGRNIFDSQPARIGFIVASSIFVLGRLGMDKEEETSQVALKTIVDGSTMLINRLHEMSDEQLRDFLALDVLSERLGGKKRSAIGRHDRAFFEAAFKVLIEEGFNVPKMEACWRA